MFKKNLKILIVFLIFLGLMTSGFRCKFQTPEEKEAMKPKSLEWWGVFDNSDSLTDVINEYKKLHPNITINYKKFRYEEYKDKILNALAEDIGPDIFGIHNTWINEYESKISPMPPSVKIPFQEVTGSVKKETVTTIKDVPSISLLKLKNDFVDVVYDDCVEGSGKDSKVLCLPLSIDTLALFYNRDLLNTARISSPPKTWEEFYEAAKRLKKIDEEGKIIQAAVPLGTSNNIERFSDILTLLMMQNGAKMNEGSSITFHISSSKENVNSALQALQFYKAFSNPNKDVYTWNKDMPNSLDAFIQGKSAFFFGYSYHIPVIKARSPKLNFSITQVPQMALDLTEESKVNVANYWVEVVSKKSANKDIAWNFIQFAASEPQIASLYLEKTHKLPSLRSLISKQLEDIDLNPFASQLLVAKSWYRGVNSGAMEKAFAEMIDLADAANKDEEYQSLLNLAASKIQQTMK